MEDGIEELKDLGKISEHIWDTAAGVVWGAFLEVFINR